MLAQGSTGRTITIKGLHQSGKSSLLVRLVNNAVGAGKRAVVLDFQLLGRDTLASENVFFRRFASSIAEQLDLPTTIRAVWDDTLSNPSSCTRYVEREILARLSQPLMLAIDDVDILFGSDFKTDFFGMLRSWHNNRAMPPRQRWKAFDLLLVTSNEPNLFIDSNNHQSPFNVGAIVTLQDFSSDHLSDINHRHGSPLYADELERLFRLLGGHPFLTRKAFYAISGDHPHVTPNELFDTATDDTGPFGDHLRNCLLRLHGNSRLMQGMVDVVAGRSCPDDLILYELHNAGLIRRTGARAEPRYELYAKYFRERLAGGA